MPRFYLDEDLPDLIAEICRRVGLDVVTTRERDRGGAADPDQLLYAAAEQRILISQNRRDMERFTKQFARDGLPHAGALLLPRSMENGDAAGVARAIMRYAREHTADMPPYMVDYLISSSD